MKRTGFTLVEVIVVMVIIGILMIFGLPKYKEHTNEAQLTSIKVDIKELESASMQYYMRDNTWPRLSDIPYNAEQIESFGKEILNKTGAIVSLDPEGNYYDIAYSKISNYMTEPSNNINYVLQNPVGSIYYIEGITEEASTRLEKEDKLPEELVELEESGVNIIVVDTEKIEGVEITDTKAEDNFTKAIELAKNGEGIYLKEGVYNLKSNDVFYIAPSKKYSNLVLRKSLTIIGEDKEKTVLVIDDTNSQFYSDGLQFAITFNAPNITLKNVTIVVNQKNIKSLWSVFNIWGIWDGSTSRNTTIENVDVIVNSPINNVFYMNDHNLNVKNVTVKGNSNVDALFYWNYGNAILTDSKFDMANTSIRGHLSKTTLNNTQFNVDFND